MPGVPPEPAHCVQMIREGLASTRFQFGGQAAQRFLGRFSRCFRGIAVHKFTCADGQRWRCAAFLPEVRGDSCEARLTMDGGGGGSADDPDLPTNRRLF